jgi:hypothetical protein
MAPRFRELKSYCDKNGWDLIGNTDHWYYEKMLPNGDVLRTKVSHAVHKEIPGNTWKHILKHQLQTTEAEFNKNK